MLCRALSGYTFQHNEIIADANTQDMHIKSHCEKCQIGISLYLVARGEETHNSYSRPSTGKERMYSTHIVCLMKFGLYHQVVLIVVDECLKLAIYNICINTSCSENMLDEKSRKKGEHPSKLKNVSR